MMAERNFSMEAYLNQIARDHQPKMAFSGKGKAAWEAWSKKAYAKLMELLGDFPKPAPLKAEVVGSVVEHGVLKERVVFDSEKHMSVPCIVCRPVDMKANRKNAAIICSHGHGGYGKGPVAGIDGIADLKFATTSANYNYGEQMAQQGFLTICPDLRIFGERKDTPDLYPGRDACNIHFLRAAIMGVFTLTLNIFDMMRCVDYLATRKEVDAERIGMMGLSLGGTMTTFTGAVDKRIRALDIICYVNSFRDFAVRDANFCGSQVVPHLFSWFDTHDVAGLIAPRPLLVEMGMWDTCFPLDDTKKSVEPLKKIYAAAGASENLEFDLHPSEHAFAGNKAFPFFKKHLLDC